MLNKVTLIGHLGADPEVRYMSNGHAVTNISVATNEVWKDKKTSERRERTEWHRIVFFNIGNYRLAEIAGEYLKKGSLVYIEGRIQTQKWQDQSGQDRYTTEIIANQMQMLSSKSGGTGHFDDNPISSDSISAQQSSTSPPLPQIPPELHSNSPTPTLHQENFDEDIPF